MAEQFQRVFVTLLPHQHPDYADLWSLREIGEEVNTLMGFSQPGFAFKWWWRWQYLRTYRRYHRLRVVVLRRLLPCLVGSDYAAARGDQLMWEFNDGNVCLVTYLKGNVVATASDLNVGLGFVSPPR